MSKLDNWFWDHNIFLFPLGAFAAFVVGLCIYTANKPLPAATEHVFLGSPHFCCRPLYRGEGVTDLECRNGLLIQNAVGYWDTKKFCDLDASEGQ